MDNKDETIKIDNIKLKINNDTPIKIEGNMEMVSNVSTPSDSNDVETLDFDNTNDRDGVVSLNEGNNPQAVKVDFDSDSINPEVASTNIPNKNISYTSNLSPNNRGSNDVNSSPKNDLNNKDDGTRNLNSHIQNKAKQHGQDLNNNQNNFEHDANSGNSNHNGIISKKNNKNNTRKNNGLDAAKRDNFKKRSNLNSKTKPSNGKSNDNKKTKKKKNNFPKKVGSGLRNKLKGDSGKTGATSKNIAKKTLSTISKVTTWLITHPVVLGIIIGIILLIFIIVSVINVFGSITTPGQGNDINKSVESFTKKDQVILEDLNQMDGITKPNAELAIYTVLFPYFETLQNDAAKPYFDQDIELSDTEKSWFQIFIQEKKDEILQSYGCDKNCQDFISDSGFEAIIKIYAKEYVADKIKSYLPWENDDSTDDGMTDTDTSKVGSALTELGDPYLKLLKGRKYKKKLKKLLSKLSDNSEPGDYDSESDFFTYLNEHYFKDDAGYESLFDQTSDSAGLSNSIVNQIKSGSSAYKVYILQRCTTNSATTTALSASGNVAGLDGTIYVTLRDYFTTNKKFVINDYYASPALYGTDTSPLPFSRYVMGVVYAEKESCIYNEACAKALMITAKSYAIGRQSSMGYSPEYIASENKTIIHLRGNVGDQDFCDVYEGCKSGTYSKDTWSVFKGEGYNNRKGPLSDEQLNNLEKWWNDIADYYVIDHDSSKFVGNQYEDYNDSCKKGSCVSQTKMSKASENETDFNNLLFNPENGGFDNTKYALYTSTTGELYAVTTGNQVCTDESNNIRQTIVDFAVSMVGKIPYYFYEGKSDGIGALGHAISKEYNENNFGDTTSVTDHSGRNKYGLDCSGFVDFVFWNAVNDNLGNGNTDTLKSVSTEITYDEIKPGDLGFLSNDSSGTNQHVGIYIGNDEWVELNPNGVTRGAYPDFKVFYRPNILKDLDSKISSGVSTGQFQSPIDNVMPSCDDYPNYSSGSYHGGTDIKVSEGTEVKAMDGGVVLESKDITSGDCSGRRHCNYGYFSYGRVIYIQHDNGVVTRYAHLSERLVSKGDKVSKGQVIAKSGNTGNSTGAHLHIEVISNGKNMSPCDYVK